ncbi:MAG: lipid-A-disaccharide synthase [Candidatus Omnitrophica bacterium]|nr:lipid-A-disaccharide synthase [Candidatus Omnitrophota bacterium]MDD5429214.1 lipid-A-disaccharide synthase [Candidatus Omnitrophota bacterium]
MTINKIKKVVIVAGDTSGDLYGGLLCEHLRKKYPLVEIFSFGGKNLAKNSNQIMDLLSHSVCGLLEVVSSIKALVKIFNSTFSYIEKNKPDLVILIDFPDFNLRLAKKLNKKYPLFYYVSPQVWAWRKGRVSLIRKYVSKMIVIFKFEKEFYEKENINALYFGHPLLELVKKSGFETKKIISFLPGSRKNEIRKHLPLMLESKRILEKKLPGYRFQILRPKNFPEAFYKQFDCKIDIIEHSYKAVEESKFIVASSGTATVEIAILEVPYVIIYKVNPLSWHILKRAVKIRFVGMVNILANRPIVKELLQNQATPENIAKTALFYLDDEENYQKLKTELKNTKNILKPEKGTECLAEFIGNYLNLS